MKQRRIKELQVLHYEGGSSVNYSPSREEEYAAVLAQAEAHQDLRFHAEINSEEVLIILPWESVIGVYATYETAEVPAPTDAICEGGESGGGADFQFTMQNPAVVLIQRNDDECYMTRIGVASFTVDGVTYNSDTDYEAFEELELTITIGGKTYEWTYDVSPIVECSDFVEGTTMSATIIGHFHGEDSIPYTFDAFIYG